MPIPTDTLARAATYRAAGKNWDWIAARVGVGVDRLRRRIDPGFREKRLAQIRAAKKRLRGEDLPNWHLVPSGGSWAVRRGGLSRAFRAGLEVGAGEVLGRQLAQRDRVKLFIFNKYGQIARVVDFTEKKDALPTG